MIVLRSHASKIGPYGITRGGNQFGERPLGSGAEVLRHCFSLQTPGIRQSATQWW